MTLENGGSIDLDRINLTDIDNQWIALFDHELRIENGNSIDLSPYIDNTDEQELSLDENILTISNGNSIDLSEIIREQNTDEQELSLDENILTISNGNSVDLSEITGEQNTDQQALSYDPQTNELSLENGGTIDLTELEEDEDADPQNEIQELSKNGNTINLSNGGGSVTIEETNYTAGTGISINNTTISARNANPLWNANKLQGQNIDASAPSAGDLLFYDGSKWIPQHGGTMIPTGGCISTQDPTPPAGFTYTGHSYLTSSGDVEWSNLTGMTGIETSVFATAVVNGKIYIIGGCITPNPYYLDLTREYDPVTDSWALKTPMPGKYGVQSATAVNGKIYVTGGKEYLTRVGANINYEYDPSSNTWDTKTSMNVGRFWHNSVEYNGKIYVMGGIIDWSDPDNLIFTNTHEMYDPATDSWTYKAPVPGALKYNFGLEVIGDKFYLIGGSNYHYNGYDGEFFNTNYVYDPNTDSWSTATPMPEKLSGYSTVLNNEIYFYGFKNEPIGINYQFFFYKYNVVNDTWQQLNNPNIDRRLSGLVGYNNKIYCIAGDDINTRIDDVEVFSPQSGNVIYYLHSAD